MELEKMDDFFANRLEKYEENMLVNVRGAREGYVVLAEAIPQTAKRLLDLGCGTGLELDEIFKRLPDISVTGIDLTKEMLDRLKEKHGDKALTLVNASYFDCNFGEERFDTAISFETMHHFSKSKKLGLYKRLHKALVSGGKYIECDYMITEQSEEDFCFSENERIRTEMGLSENEFYHYDTPCTIENQMKLFYEAGFSRVEKLWRMGNTTIIEAEK